MSYDTKCEMLARFFLADVNGLTEEHVRELAQTIQDAIEGYLESKGITDAGTEWKPGLRPNDR